MKWPLMGETITWGDRIEMIKFILTTKRFTYGEKVKKFENEWSQWLGAKHSLFVSSGSTANTLLVSAVKDLYKLKDGDKVRLPACTWVTNVSPIFQLGLKPIFCDINLQNYSFDLNEAERIAQIHPDIKMIFVTHLLGFPADNHKLRKLFPNALIIDDICESHGCKDVEGYKYGARSLGSTFSFYFGHHMTTIEGGMICTNDEEIYQLAKMFRSHGFVREASLEVQNYYKENYPELNPLFTFSVPGFNMRSTELNAVLGLEQLKRLDFNIEARRKNFQTWIDNLNPELYYTDYDVEGNSSFALPLIYFNLDNVEKICNILTEEKVEYRLGTIGGGSQVYQPYILNSPHHIPNNLTNSDIIHKNSLYVGNHPELTEEQIINLCKKLNNV